MSEVKRPKPYGANNSRVLPVRLDQELNRMLVTNAERAGKPVSAYVRDVLRNALKKSTEER